MTPAQIAQRAIVLQLLGGEHQGPWSGDARRELRVARGISQEQLAYRTGVHTTVIGRMKRGAREPAPR
jgi:hypothetical protein